MADGIIGYPFDSIVKFDEQGNPTFDRAVSSKVLKTLISKLFTTGVMPNPSNNLLVTAGTEGMTTVVEEGFCVIEGGLKLIVEPQTMMHQASDTHYDRIDTVVMRWDNNDNVRHCGLFVVEGTPAKSPVRPTLTREGSIYEIGLADVLIKANSTVISANRITDTRYDDERCGVVRSISEYDTTYIYQQVQADLAGFKENEQAEFVAWFETIRGILDKDVAGHLQNEIDDLRLNGGNSNLAPVESSTTATVATNAGKFVVVEGVLYKALSNIAIGDTYVSSGAGANIERKLVGDELAGINQNLTYRWNPTTDYFEYYVNGSWIQDRYAGFNGAYVIKNGVLSSLGGSALQKASFPDTNGTKVVPTYYGTSGDNYVVSMTGASTMPSGMIVFSNGIDTAEYRGVRIKWSATQGDASWNTTALFGEVSTPSVSGDCRSVFNRLAYLSGGQTSTTGDNTYDFANSSGITWLTVSVRGYDSTVTVSIKEIELIKR